uniref:DUF7596 domain-containing protein n=1 Tax=Trichuris muris TaxID=70415 RepID=A0A5S6R0A5_TRIMR
MLSVKRTTMPGLLPAQHSDPRHQITFKWPQVDSFVKRTISPTSPFIKQMSITVLAHDEKSRTVVATDSIGSKLYGAAAMTVINDSNGYLCFCECDQEMTDCNVVITVDNNDENCLQIRSKAIAKVTHFQGDFMKLHFKKEERCLEAHMFDVLIRKAFGLFDFDHLRNVTYDIPGDSRRIPLFRDQLGFILTDSRQFILLDINIKALDELFSQSYQFRNGESNQHIRVFDLNDPVATALGEFDQEVVGENRFDQLNAVYGKFDSQCIIALQQEGDAQLVNGYALFTNNKIMCLYAKSQSIMTTLLSGVVSRMDKEIKSVTLFSTFNGGIHAWLRDVVSLEFSEGTVYRRLHTRCIPSKIRWDYVYAANIGWQIA